jgi:RNA-binding protein YlmH
MKMETLKSNSEIKSEVRDMVTEWGVALEADKSHKQVVLSPFLEPWTLAVTIGELKSRRYRVQEAAPNPSPRMRCLQVAHYQNLLDWTPVNFDVLRLRPENLFDPPSRAEMVEKLSHYLPDSASIGDVLKIEGGWAICVREAFDVPESIPQFTIRHLPAEEIYDLPPATKTGEKKVSVSSPRIDAVASKALNPSREQIKKHLESGGVLLNYEPARKPGLELAPDDVVAVRGGGRFRFIDVIDVTRKGRVQALVEILNGP